MVGMSARRVITTGILITAIAILALIGAMLLGAKLGKYLAAPAIIALCVGASIVLHGALDWWRG